MQSTAQSKEILLSIDTASIETKECFFGTLMLFELSFKLQLFCFDALIFPKIGFEMLDKYFAKLYFGDPTALRTKAFTVGTNVKEHH